MPALIKIVTMKYIIFIFLSWTILCCSDDNIPLECSDLGFDNNPELFENGFYVKGTINGSSWEAANGYFVIITDTLLERGISLCFADHNTCNLQNLIFKDNITDGGWVNNYLYEFGTKNVNPPIYSIFNYGGLDEAAVSQEYDSLVISPAFENFIIFDYLSPDSTIIEGRIQLHLTKRWCKEFDSGDLVGCDTPPDYLDGEPLDIKIKDGEFRLQIKEF